MGIPKVDAWGKREKEKDRNVGKKGKGKRKGAHDVHMYL